MNNYSKFANMFSGVDPKKLEEAIKKAEILSKNPKICEAFSKTDSKKIASIISNMSGEDKKRLINEILSPDNAELIKLIKNNL